MIKATSQSVCSGITGCQVELLGSGAELIKEYKGVTVAMYRSLRGHMPEELAKEVLVNDVDYFADAYMKVLGSRLDDDDLEHIRDKRIINLEGDADTVIVDFLQKPNGDTTQENLIDRLEKLIFQISMVANISDENFGTSSGIAMKYKLQGMSNLAKTKERKFTSGMNRRYKLIFSNPVSGMKEDDWVKLHYHFTPNIPSNVLEERYDHEYSGE